MTQATVCVMMGESVLNAGLNQGGGLSGLPSLPPSYYYYYYYVLIASGCSRGGGGRVLDQWLGIGVPLRVSNPDPV